MGRTIAEQIAAEGEARGVAAATRGALVRVLTRRYGPLSAEVAAAVEQADVPTMNAWLDRAATADSLEEVGILPT